ncbi:tail fiber domain-containing protein [Paenibacillus sp. M1]|uniref:Tail fiber domain-containing protein n=1 Tax=Paenibacillus haidiansis TaxID=1574488 RepID=A0ABU7VVG4_9BACL
MGKEFVRMRYFDGLFLNEEDYKLDQEFFLRLQRLHNRYLHTWGIVVGLKVEPFDSSGEKMKVRVTEGLALNRVQVTDEKTQKKESISQEILIYDGHPDNPVDLSEYRANENIYIWVSYLEEAAERNIERGQGKEIHTWERGQIGHGIVKPTDPSKIVLARVIPKKGDKGLVIDKSCIFDYDSDTKQTPLRVYAGAAGKKVVAETLVVKTKSDSDDMSSNDETLIDMPTLTSVQNGAVLEVQAPTTKFSGNVDIAGDLSLVGELILRNTNKSQDELRIMNSFVQVNSENTDDPDYHFPGPRDGGLEVYRGNNGTEDARIVWVENERSWKVGLGNQLEKIAYGSDWESLTKGGIVDGLHLHSRLTSPGGNTVGFNDSGKLYLDSDLALKDAGNIWLKATDKNAVDSAYGLGWFGKGKPFAGAEADGPVLFGKSGGILGTRGYNPDGVTLVEKPALSWNNAGNVGIGPRKTLEDNLDVDGNMRILSGKNPLRFTSVWSGFPDDKLNGAEISNDTTNHKTLMIVGNQSAGQGRKVSVWDRLDVNGFLYVNGKLQASEEIIPSVGKGSRNGIIFPGDPGGGSGDLAWIKFFPRTGENCSLEIGTSNDKEDHISLNPSGNVGIGTLEPQEKLDVAGGVRILTDKNPIRFTSSWRGFPDSVKNEAEISNDTTNYKALMIVGNSSGLQGRKVAIWDRLDVNGFLQVYGNAAISGDLTIGGTIKAAVLNFDGQFSKLDVANYFTATVRCADFCIGYSGRRGGPGRALVDSGSTLVLNYGNDWANAAVHSSLHVSGAIVPSAGSGNNGIIFPSDPGGGWGDSAWIKYYPTSGENCVLDIGVSNDSGDRINLHASGGVYAYGNWYYYSSREYKDDIADVSIKEAKQLLDSLNPVSFHYKGSNKNRTMGFIAEEVPGQVADPHGQAVSPMEIIAVLTSVLKDQQKAITRMQKQIGTLMGA